MEKKSEYLDAMQAKLDRWEAAIGAIEISSGRSEAEKPQYLKAIDELRAQHKGARQKLDALRQASDDAWEDLRSGVEAAWDALGNAVKSATSHFKSENR